MPHLTAHEARVTATAAATMRTFASPTTDAPVPLAVWRTEMAPGSVGPVHRVDRDQVVVVVAGRLTADVDGEPTSVSAGDALLLPTGARRQLSASGSAALVTITASLPGASAVVGNGDPVPVPWAR